MVQKEISDNILKPVPECITKSIRSKIKAGKIDTLTKRKRRKQKRSDKKKSTRIKSSRLS